MEVKNGRVFHKSPELFHKKCEKPFPLLIDFDEMFHYRMNNQRWLCVTRTTQGAHDRFRSSNPSNTLKTTYAWGVSKEDGIKKTTSKS